jgi:hypothetical protein
MQGIPERQVVLLAWGGRRLAYLKRVAAAIAADVPAAGRRFAELHTRCCVCGRTLRDATSKTYGIGPDCRAGIPAEVLARYLTPQVGRAHAAHLAADAS